MHRLYFSVLSWMIQGCSYANLFKCRFLKIINGPCCGAYHTASCAYTHMHISLPTSQGRKVQSATQKCSHFQREDKFIDHIVSERGVATDTGKLHAVSCWPRPTKALEVKHTKDKQFMYSFSYARVIIKYRGHSLPWTSVLLPFVHCTASFFVDYA